MSRSPSRRSQSSSSAAAMTDEDVKNVFTVKRDDSGAAETVMFAIMKVPMTQRVSYKPGPGEVDTLPLNNLVRSWTATGVHTKGYPVRMLYFNYQRLRYLLHLIRRYNDWRTTVTSDAVRAAMASDPDSQLHLDLWNYKTRLFEPLTVAGLKVPKIDDLAPVKLDGLFELVSWLSREFDETLKTAKQLLSEGQVSYDGLALVMAPGKHVTVGISGMSDERLCCEVVTSFFEERNSLFGKVRSFRVTLMFAATVGDRFSTILFGDTVASWDQARPVSSLLYQPISMHGKSALRDHITARSAKYIKYALGVHYVQYERDAFYAHAKRGAAASGHALRQDGRIVLDMESALSFSQSIAVGADLAAEALVAAVTRYSAAKRRSERSGGGPDAGRDTTASAGFENMHGLIMCKLPDSLLMMTWPALIGFSITAKGWGHCLVDGLTDIAFDEHAFDKLVMPPDRKELIQAVTVSPDMAFTDIVKGKGAGSVFLLHGPPGVGKTLTAEALAELLHRPLYIASMGELGSTAEQLEQRLQSILDLCGRWGAIVLLDEADVFLERREKSEVVRNALVCVMLRLLEYHQGVIFLTSNRVANLDPAVASRVTLALGYERLNADARSKVWATLMAQAKLPPLDKKQAKELAARPLNGRQIKNSIRLAQALAAWRKEKFGFEHIRRTATMQSEHIKPVAGEI